MAEESRCDILGNLPIELVLEIFSLLDFRDLLMTQAVSKTWFALVNCDDVWKRFLPDDYPDKEISPRRDFHWLGMPPCHIKMKVLNHYRILKNWRENTFNRFELKDTSPLTAYDGKTLVVSLTYPRKGFKVYQVERGKVWLRQTIKTNSPVIHLVTNSKFIVVYTGSYIYIYKIEHLRKKVYKMAYILSKTRENNNVFRLSDAFASKIYKNPDGDSDGLEPGDCLILGNTLFGFSWSTDPFSRRLYAWDLENEDLLNSKDIRARAHHLLSDGKQVYCWTERRIIAFDDRGEVIYQNEEYECSFVKMLMNANVLIAITMKHSPEYMNINADRLIAGPLLPGLSYCSPGITCFDKSTGLALFDRDYDNDHRSYVFSSYALLDHRLNVLYDISDDSVVSAVNPFTEEVIWNSHVGESCLNLSLGDLHCIGGERCLFVSSFSGREYHAYDTRTGKYQYVLQDNDGYGLEAHYDIMLCYASKPGCVVVLVYS